MFDGTTAKDHVLTADLASTAWDAGKQVTYSFVIDLYKELITQWDYAYTTAKTAQTFTAPKTGTYRFEAWGAAGGTHTVNANTANGGKGGYTKGEIILAAGQKVYVYVGEAGSNTNRGDYIVDATFNGGGQGAIDNGYVGAAGSGGGATDFRLVSGDWNNTTSLNSRIMVAGGGGGGEPSEGSTALGGNSGGLTGYEGGYASNGTASTGGGKGGTQSGGGAGGRSNGNSGQFGIGGNGGYDIGSNRHFGGGGGGGYYGGGSGGQESMRRIAGGGGSSFISGMVPRHNRQQHVIHRLLHDRRRRLRMELRRKRRLHHHARSRRRHHGRQYRQRLCPDNSHTIALKHQQ